MKTSSNPFLHLPSILAATIAIATSAHAADFTWDGGTGNWDAHQLEHRHRIRSHHRRQHRHDQRRQRDGERGWVGGLDSITAGQR